MFPGQFWGHLSSTWLPLSCSAEAQWAVCMQSSEGLSWGKFRAAAMLCSVGIAGCRRIPAVQRESLELSTAISLPRRSWGGSSAAALT